MLAYRISLCYNLQGSTWKKEFFREKSHVLTYRPVPDWLSVRMIHMEENKTMEVKK